MFTEKDMERLLELSIKYGVSLEPRPAIKIDDVLSKEDFLEFRYLLESKDPSLVDSNPERYSNTKNYGKNSGGGGRYDLFSDGRIQQIIIEKAKKLFDAKSELELVHVVYHENLNKPTPILEAHFDMGLASHLLDLIISTEHEWPIVIEDTEYIPKENSAILFYGKEQIHYRPDWVNGNPGEKNSIVLFNFVDRKDWYHLAESEYANDSEYQEMKNLRVKKYKSEFYQRILDKKLPALPKPRGIYKCKQDPSHIIELEFLTNGNPISEFCHCGSSIRRLINVI